MKYIEIRLTKVTLFLTEQEIRKLLHADDELYTIAINRGKAFKRSCQSQKREEEKRKYDSMREWEGL